MNRTKRRLTALLLVLAAGSTALQAQTPDDWENPPEPAVKYKVTVAVSPAGAGYPSGAAKLVKGGTTNITTSDVADFTFRYWTLNGVQYTTDRSFTYTVGTENAAFVAVYEYNPQDPEEPTSNPTYRLYLDCQPAGACSFNRTSGEKTVTGTQVSLSATPNQDFVFQGWYEGETLLSNTISFNYTMTAADHHLTARFEYNPDDPFEPESAGTEGVDNTEPLPGDANGDGTVDVKDIVAVVNRILEKPSATFKFGNADVNGDNVIDVKDIVAIIRIITNQ